MSSGRRGIERENREKGYGDRKLNIGKIILMIFAIAIIIATICFVVFKLSKKQDTNQEYDEKIEEAIVEEVTEVKEKTIEEIVSEFGGEVKEQLKPDTYIIMKDGAEYTAYLDGEIVQGRISLWNGGSSQPAIDEAGNVNIYNAEELKWIADQVTSGVKNFGGVTITLRNNIDLGARKNADGVWEGTEWTPIIGFLDELPPIEPDPNSVNNENQTPAEEPALPENAEVIKENLKRFAGVFDGNGFWIRGMNINSEKDYQGLFGFSVGTIANLTVKYSNIKGNSACGAIVGLNGGVIEKCTIENVEVKGKEKVGGFSGISMSGSIIRSSSVNRENTFVYADKYAGGITGYSNNNTGIQETVNLANVSGKDYVGGITGIAFYGTTIEDCVNNAKNVVGENYVGGLAGYSQAQIESSSNNTLENKQGVISGKNYVGGLVGLNNSMGNINNSYNAGKVIIETANGGGIAGLNGANIANCYNVGTLEINKNASKIGGICGQNISESGVYTSYNVGKIIGNKDVGGLVGANFGTIDKAYFLNNITEGEALDKDYSKTESEMKDTILSDIGSSFEKDNSSINSGYPVLIWQQMKQNS